MKTNYKLLIEQVKSLIEDVDYYISNLSNVSALIYNSLEDLNWAGFYLVKNQKLVLGPFQGKVACTTISIGRGVCGTAVSEDKTQLVHDVHEFSGHIACDSASNSEVVVPIHKNGEIIGVLDIDSPKVGRFTEEDVIGLEGIVEVLEQMNW
ncbi:Free methionine-(R)-sulfoxide reductase, contains GAF domain protein [Lachnospiraceae bacterium TWA4]|nr:Free methionine-(R)-sulfoxide reductase, contains GAF domain protein [Lachnospiraceae bacterium TWA4]